jgi:hypothetical protein
MYNTLCCVIDVTIFTFCHAQERAINSNAHYEDNGPEFGPDVVDVVPQYYISDAHYLYFRL